MPIRPRISDPYGEDYKEFSRRRKYGPAPRSPRKPTNEERKPFVDALNAVPIGKRMPQREWTQKWVLPYMKRQFEVWGIMLAIYPVGTVDAEHKTTCNGVLIRQLGRHPRTGQQPQLLLKGTDIRIWYGKVIHWIEDTNYGG